MDFISITVPPWCRRVLIEHPARAPIHITYEGDADGAGCPADEAPAKPLGAKAVPHVGELWLTRGGGIAAVAAKVEDRIGKPLRCVLLTRGDAAVDVPHVFEVNGDGRRGTKVHTYDLISWYGDFRDFTT